MDDREWACSELWCRCRVLSVFQEDILMSDDIIGVDVDDISDNDINQEVEEEEVAGIFPP